MPGALAGRVALVTGASRGMGKGIAVELGAAGALVYVTGRSTAGASTEGLPGTVEETAAEVTRAGGSGVGVACDHDDDGQVAELFRRITREAGRLDALVNNVWGGYEQFDLANFAAPFWEQPVERFERMYRAGLRAHFVASRLAAPMLIARQRGVIVTISAGDEGRWLGGVPYDTLKSACSRMTFGMAQNLKAHGIAAVGVLPGFTRTERVLAAFAGRPTPPGTESPRYSGRAVAALAADAEVMRHTGRVLPTGSWAEIYGFTDVDGKVVPPFKLPAGSEAPRDRF